MTNALSVSLFDYDHLFISSSMLFATILASLIAFYSFRFYRQTGLSYLRGLGVGFVFISISDALLAADVWLRVSPEIFNVVFWARLVSMSYGFAFLALTYYYKNKDEIHILSLTKIGSLSIIPLVVMIGIIIVTPPIYELPSYTNVDEYFRVLNLLMLGYVVKNTLDFVIESGRKEYKYLPMAYSLLWLGQFSALIFNLEGSVSAFVLQVAAKISGLGILVGMLYHALKQGSRMEIDARREV